jgi:hypothetical protein
VLGGTSQTVIRPKDKKMPHYARLQGISVAC